MSDTETTVPQDGGAPASEPAAPVITGSTEAPAPVETETTTETTEQAEETRRGGTDRRLAKLTARNSALGADLAQLRAEVERLRRGEQPTQQQVQIPAEWQPIVEQEVEARTALRAAQQAREAFHAAGRAAHADWGERCQSLMDMGADARFAELLVETQDGARIAAALADEPEEIERIARIQSDRGRAIELGKYAAKLEARPAPPRRAAQVSRAPAPIRPVNGSVNPEPNPYLMGPQEAVAWAEKQEADRRRQQR